MITVPNPNIEEYKVHYISESESLEDIPPAITQFIDPASKAFFLDKESKANEFLSSISSIPIKQWYQQLFSKKCALVILEKGKGHFLESPGGSYLIFQNDSDSFVNNEEWSHSGSSMDFDKKLYNPNNYFPELLELLKFSAVHFSYWYGGAKLIKLGDDNLAINDEWLPLFLEELDIDGLNIEQIRIFYEDYSGNHLFYDNQFNIWCGGVDEADFWKTELSGKEVLNSIFLAHTNEEFPAISNIAKGKYL